MRASTVHAKACIDALCQELHVACSLLSLIRALVIRDFCSGGDLALSMWCGSRGNQVEASCHFTRCCTCMCPRDKAARGKGICLLPGGFRPFHYPVFETLSTDTQQIAPVVQWRLGQSPCHTVLSARQVLPNATKDHAITLITGLVGTPFRREPQVLKHFAWLVSLLSLANASLCKRFRSGSLDASGLPWLPRLAALSNCC